MIKRLKKILFILLPIALGIFLIWYSFNQLSSQDIQSIKNSFKTANYGWVLLSLILGMLSHLSRAYRWYFLLEPLGYKPKLTNNILTVLVAYLLNLVVPRSGEIARAGSINKYENIPFEKAFGTIIAERISDVIMLLLIIAIAFFFQTELIASHLFKEENTNTSWLKISLFLLLPIMAIIGYKLIKKSKNAIAKKIISFINGLIDGAKSIITMKKKWQYILHTLFIWAMYILMFYVVTLALPETQKLSFSAIIVGFVIGALSMALTNGGLGTYPVFVAGALTLYGVAKNPALAFGWIMWTAQTAMVVFFGVLSLFILPIYNNSKKQ